MPEPWRRDAACRGMDTAMWFAEQDNKGTTGLAKRICSGCPVQQECLDLATRNHERFGVWGGRTKNERLGSRRRRRRAS